MATPDSGVSAQQHLSNNISWKILGNRLNERLELSCIEALDKYISKLSERDIGLLQKLLDQDTVAIGKLKPNIIRKLNIYINDMLHNLCLPGIIIGLALPVSIKCSEIVDKESAFSSVTIEVSYFIINNLTF